MQCYIQVFREGCSWSRSAMYHGLQRSELVFDFETATGEELRRAAFNADRPLKEGVLEWIRMDLGQTSPNY